VAHKTIDKCITDVKFCLWFILAQVLTETDHVYYWHPGSSVDRYRRSTPRSTRDRHSIDISVDPRLTHARHLGRQTFNFRWHSIEWRSILAMTTHWISVDVSIATLRSAVGRMSVVCQWCIGSMSVMYSSQYPSSNGGILPNTPSASVRSKFQLFLVIFCASKIKLLWRQSFIRVMPQGSIFDWCWWFLTWKMALSFPSCWMEGQCHLFAMFTSLFTFRAQLISWLVHSAGVVHQSRKP